MSKIPVIAVVVSLFLLLFSGTSALAEDGYKDGAEPEYFVLTSSAQWGRFDNYSGSTPQEACANFWTFYRSLYNYEEYAIGRINYQWVNYYEVTLDGMYDWPNDRDNPNYSPEDAEWLEWDWYEGPTENTYYDLARQNRKFGYGLGCQVMSANKSQGTVGSGWSGSRGGYWYPIYTCDDIPSLCQLADFDPEECTAPETPNPIQIGTGLKRRNAIDWTSPREPRFQFARNYLSQDFATHSEAARSYGDLWASMFDEAFRRQAYSETVLFLGDGGRRLFIDQGNDTYQPYREQNTLEMTVIPGKRNSYNPRNRYVDDGFGVRRAFLESQYRSDLSVLASISWPDGYNIDINRDSLDRILSIEDNRENRAEFVWLTVGYTSSSMIAPKQIVREIQIDTGYSGSGFTPDVRLSYEYDVPEDSTIFQGEIKLLSVTLTDLSNGTETTVQAYDYQGQSPEALSSPLSVVYDGRLDSQGQLLPTQQYAYDGIRATGSAYVGGAEAHSVEKLPDGRISVTNSLGKETIYSFQEVSGATSVTSIEGIATSNCLGSVATIDYTPNAGAPLGYPYSTTERNGSVTTYERNSRGLITNMVEDANGLSPRTTQFIWHADLRLPVEKRSALLVENWTYDSAGLVTAYSQTDNLPSSPTYGETRTTNYSYQELSSGLTVLAELDGPGVAVKQGKNIIGAVDVTSFTHNSDGTIQSITDPNGLVTRFEDYSAMGQPQRIFGPDGIIWRFEYDIHGWPLSITRGFAGPNPATTILDYDAIGQVTSLTDPTGQTWSYQYNTARQLVASISPSGERAEFAYDPMGNVTQISLSDGVNPATFNEAMVYDELGRLMTLLGANGQTTSYRYDVEDNMVETIDALSFSTSFGFDALNRIFDVVDRSNSTTILVSNEANQITSHVDPRGLVTTFEYNGFGEVVREVSPDRGTTSYVHDSRGLVVSMTDGRGVVTDFEYDHGGRITARRFPDNPDLDQTFQYDLVDGANISGNGKLGLTTEQVGTTEITHGAENGLPAVEIRNVQGAVYSTSYSYDLKDSVTRMTYPSGREVVYQRDADGRVVGVKFDVKQSDVGTGLPLPPLTVVTNLTYLPKGPMSQMLYGDGSTHNASYDTSYRLTGLLDIYSGLILRDEAYTWTSRNNLAGVTNNLDPLLNQTFGYSPREFLASADGGWGELDWLYDGVGNRTQQMSYAAGTTATDVYSYPSLSNQLDQIMSSTGAARTLTYDAAGNVTFDNRNGSAYAYAYDSTGRMSDFSINGVVQAEYEYNALGQQVVRRLTQLGRTIHSLHDQDGNRIAEYLYDETLGSSSLIREYIWANGQVVGVYENGTLYFVRTDYIGRPVFATDGAAAVVWEASYLPFGGVQASNGPNPDLRFPGQWFQAETGLHQNWMRDYDPTTGRYIQADPLGLVDGASVYGYALQNPGRYTDPRGEDTSIQIWDGAGWGNSSFGHVSGQIDGTTYSFGQSGMSVLPHLEYLQKNSFRGGVDISLNLSSSQEMLLRNCLQQFNTAYAATSNNCTDPWESCLKDQGLYFQDAITPRGLLNGLTGNNNLQQRSGGTPLVGSVVPIRQSLPSTGSSAPWAPDF